MHFLFEQRHGTQEEFAAYLARVRGQTTEEEEPPAPSFRVTSLSGRTLDLKALRGKIVILNFWYIGCGPCKEEIPGLNTLVKDHADHNDIMFIAFANDTAGELKEFLKKTPFLYEVVPDGKRVALEFGVKFFPTHVIIDRKGSIVSTVIGGGENRHENLRPLISRLLKAK